MLEADAFWGNSVGSAPTGTTRTTCCVISDRGSPTRSWKARLRLLEDHVAARMQTNRAVGLIRGIAERVMPSDSSTTHR